MRRKDCSVLAVQGGGGAGNAMGFVVVLVFLCKRIRDRTKTEEERGGRKRGFTIDNRLLYNTQYHPVWGGGEVIVNSRYFAGPRFSLFVSFQFFNSSAVASER